jgi:hypothetical protein
MVQEVISQNEDLKRRVRELEETVGKQAPATREAAKEPAKDPAKATTEAAAKEPPKEVVQDAPKEPPKEEAASEVLKAAKSPWGKLQLGGAIELEAGKRRDFAAVRTSDFTLAAAEFDFEADVVDWAKAELSLQWDSGADKITVNEAMITIGRLSKFPVYLKAGRGVVPVGISSGTTVAARLEESLTLAGPLTIDVFEAKEDYVLLGVKGYGFHAGAYIFNGSTNQVGGGGKRLEHYGFTAGYGIKSDNISLDVGVHMIDSVFDSDGLTSAFSELQDRVKRGYIPGLAAHAKLGLWGFSLIGEYDTATRHARLIRDDIIYDIQPRAWQVEVGYTTDIIFGKKTYVAFNYSKTIDLLGTFPKQRMLVTVGSWLAENIRLAAEYGNEQDYSKIRRGTGRDSDLWTLRLTYEW